MKKTGIFRVSKIIAKPICTLLFPLKVQNLENFPETGKVIICSNHTCMKDPIYISIKPKRMIRYMAKKELFANKLVSKIITGMGAFPVERGKGDQEAIHTADQILQDGDALAIFIEGTRSKDGKLGRPRSGAAMLAYQNQAPVLPVCITTKDGKPPKLFHKAVISYGKLIPFEDLGIREGTGTEFREASRLIMSKIAEMREHDQPIADSFR
ncbi:MAG: lysophospholipid acyltransferase family protein [Oscillospiraceae bacterium]|nr:lysophospholipid acyltransferase family protein [Oscillospiraceae bacterium]